MAGPGMTSDEILAGLGLVVILGVASQLVARRLRLPAIVVLLPVGFLAGIATDDVHPDQLLGTLFQPFVSLAVGVILFEAGLRLSLREIGKDARRAVERLVLIGVLVTWLGIAAATTLLFDGLGELVPALIGAVLVVSGPTVVLPLLAFVRPARDVRSLLTWEGVLVDPIGALLGVIVFHAALSGDRGEVWRPGIFVGSIAVGALVGAAAAGILWLLLREIQRVAPRLAVPAVLMMVLAGLVVGDALRDDSGFVATTLMGVVLANQHRIDLRLMAEFHETLVQLLIGVLFVLIAASVTPDEIRAVLPEAVLLVAAMVLVIRPLAVALATLRTSLPWRERAFAAWMAPRGIVAGATASAFGLELQEAGVVGAEKLLPIAFVAIFGTVVLYGLTAAPVARLLGVAGRGGTLVLVVGDTPHAREAAQELASTGVEVRLWEGRPMVEAVTHQAELEEVTDAVLMSSSADFNELAAAELRIELGHDHVAVRSPEEHYPEDGAGDGRRR